MCPDGTPWVFLCASAVIEYLSKLAAGADQGGAGFKQFIHQYFPDGYLDFKYKSGTADLPEQMYHVLRCGIVHSFSMIPDSRGQDKGARDRSVVMSHHEVHLSPYSSSLAPDACCLRADAFVADIETATNKLFTAAQAATPVGQQVAQNIESWLQQHPPIRGDV
jgi:hypothetical protein